MKRDNECKHECCEWLKEHWLSFNDTQPSEQYKTRCVLYKLHIYSFYPKVTNFNALQGSSQHNFRLILSKRYAFLPK